MWGSGNIIYAGIPAAALGAADAGNGLHVTGGQVRLGGTATEGTTLIDLGNSVSETVGFILNPAGDLAIWGNDGTGHLQIFESAADGSKNMNFIRGSGSFRFFLTDGANSAALELFATPATDRIELRTVNCQMGSAASIGLAAGTLPTARLEIIGGGSSAGTAPFKYRAGVVLLVPENGAKEYDGTNEFLTTGGVRHTLAKTLTNTASLNFGNTLAQASADLTIGVTGAALGDPVVLGVPNASVNANSCYTAWVSAADTVTIRFNNYSAAAIDPAVGTFRVSVLKY